MMKLTMLHIYESGYGANACLIGVAKFSNENGEVALTLRPEHVHPVLEAVAEALVASAKEVATDLTASIITDSVPKIGLAKD
jgi:hypothetical protein